MNRADPLAHRLEFDPDWQTQRKRGIEGFVDKSVELENSPLDDSRERETQAIRNKLDSAANAVGC